MNKTNLLLAFLLINFNLNAQVWHNYNIGGNVASFYFDSTANELYLGGYFTSFNGVPANNIVKWDGQNWIALGDGFNGGAIHAITRYNGEIYAAGDFDSSGTTPFKQPIAKWDGMTWLPLDTVHQFNNNTPGFTKSIYNLVEWNGSLIVAGNFNCLQNNLNLRCITRWDGNNLFSMAPLYSDLYITCCSALGVFQNNLFIGVAGGGAVDSCPSSGQPGSDVFAFMKYDPVCSTFVEVGGGVWPMGSGVRDILNYNGSLYLALTVSPAWAGNFITRYDGINFYPVSNGFNDNVESLAEYQGQIVAAGRFTADGTNTQPLEHVAVWDGSNWNPLPGGCDLNKWVYKIYGHDSLLFAYGVFDSCGVNPVNNSVVYPSTITGLHEFLPKKKNKMEVFPNPANQQFTIIVSEYVELNKNEILINDVTGREISRITLKKSSLEVNASVLQTGLYIAKQLVNGQLKSSSKIIINR